MMILALVAIALYAGGILFFLRKHRSSSPGQVPPLPLPWGAGIALFFLGFYAYPLFHEGVLFAPRLSMIAALTLYLFLTLHEDFFLLVLLRALLSLFLFAFFLLAPEKREPLRVFEATRSFHLFSLSLGFSLMCELAVLSLLYTLKERGVRAPFPSFPWRTLPPLEGIERTLGQLRRAALLALTAVLLSGIALGFLRQRFRLDLYVLVVPALILFLLGLELYRVQRQRWGRRFAYLGAFAGVLFIVVWLFQWLNLLPHRLPSP